MGGTVLVADDEDMIRDLYAAWLADDHEVREAADGAAALDALDPAVDVVLLDRRMPGLSGDAVLRQIREGDVDCRVVMVSAVDPDEDVLDLPFDDYLVKPAEGADLPDAVELSLARTDLRAPGRRYAAVLAKLGLLETQRAARAEDVLATLRDRRDALREELGDRAGTLDERAAAGELVLHPPSAVTDDR